MNIAEVIESIEGVAEVIEMFAGESRAPWAWACIAALRACVDALDGMLD